MKSQKLDSIKRTHDISKSIFIKTRYIISYIVQDDIIIIIVLGPLRDYTADAVYKEQKASKLLFNWLF